MKSSVFNEILFTLTKWYANARFCFTINEYRMQCWVIPVWDVPVIHES